MKVYSDPFIVVLLAGVGFLYFRSGRTALLFSPESLLLLLLLLLLTGCRTSIG